MMVSNPVFNNPTITSGFIPDAAPITLSNAPLANPAILGNAPFAMFNSPNIASLAIVPNLVKGCIFSRTAFVNLVTPLMSASPMELTAPTTPLIELANPSCILISTPVTVDTTTSNSPVDLIADSIPVMNLPIPPVTFSNPAPNGARDTSRSPAPLPRFLTASTPIPITENTPPKESFKFSKVPASILNGLDKSKSSNTPTTLSLIKCINLLIFSITGSKASLIPSIAGDIALKTFLNASCFSVWNDAPIRANAAFMLDREPVYVSLALVACSPNDSSIIVANVSKSIEPFVTISLTDASVVPIDSAMVAATLTPLASICLICIVINLP